jgi:hypothetical protein
VNVPGIGTQSSRMMFTHEGQKMFILDSFCRTINQYDVVYNHRTHLANQAGLAEAARLKATQALPGVANQNQNQEQSEPVA